MAKTPVTESRTEISHVKDMDIVDGLCEVCRQNLSNWDKLVNGAKLSHHNSVLELKRSAREGCKLCALCMSDAIYNGNAIDTTDSETDEEDLSEVESLNTQSRGDIESENSDQTTACRISSRVFINGLPQGYFAWCLRDEDEGRIFSVIVFCPVPDLAQHNPERPQDNPSRGELVLLAKKWLEHCSHQHDKCFQSSHGQKLPTRLLHIDHQNLHLVLSVNFPSNTKYATLSHCWGSGKNLKLTKSTLQAFESNIPRDEICKTFEDAIFITSMLDLEYLWIDSLCIIQDDEDDWRQESVLMSVVYGNSFLNIAAAGASNGSEGCFFPDNSMRINNLRVATIEAGQKKLYDCVLAEIYQHCIASTPLASRAWALQERLLAPRTLHFSRAQLFWECNEIRLCESLPYKVPPQVFNSDWYLETSALSNFWKKIVYVYSRCQLTKPRDKLVALSGIIRKIQLQRDDQCVAGLWKRKMEIELLWRVERPSSRSAVYVAPSWSWAAVNGPIVSNEFYIPDTTELDKKQELYVHVLNVYVKPYGSDPLGEICDGNLSLLCRTLIRTTRLGRASIETRIPGLQVAKMEIKGCDKVLEFEVWVSWDCEEPLEEVYMLPVTGLVSGLIIVPTGQEQGQYKRLGIFQSGMKGYPRDETEKSIRVLMNPEYCAGTDAFAGFIDDSGYDKEHWFLNIV